MKETTSRSSCFESVSVLVNNELDLKFCNKFPFKETKMAIKVKLIESSTKSIFFFSSAHKQLKTSDLK